MQAGWNNFMMLQVLEEFSTQQNQPIPNILTLHSELKTKVRNNIFLKWSKLKNKFYIFLNDPKWFFSYSRLQVLKIFRIMTVISDFDFHVTNTVFFFMIKKENLTSFLHYQEEMNYKTLTAYVLHFSIILSPKFPCKNIKRKPYLEAAVKWLSYATDIAYHEFEQFKVQGTKSNTILSIF